MKNLKNTLAGLGMIAVLTVGATSAKAGLLMSDKATSSNNQKCTFKLNKGFINNIAGVIIAGFPEAAGLLMSDAPTKGCGSTETNGLLVSD